MRTLLALEWSSSHRGTALLRLDEGEGGTELLSENVISDPTGVHPVEMIERVLRQAEVEREEVGGLAVGLGPGSYTGIRIAIAVAQGWRLGRAIQLFGVSSMDVLAAQAWQEGMRGELTFVIDAHRGEFYRAVYKLSAGLPQCRASLRLARKREIQQALLEGQAVAGPEADLHFTGARSLFPSAHCVAQLTSRGLESVAGEELEPIYLRPVQFVKAPKPRNAAG